MAALSAPAMCAVGSEVYDHVVLMMYDSGALKHFMSKTPFFQSLDKDAAKLSLCTHDHIACGRHSEFLKLLTNMVINRWLNHQMRITCFSSSTSWWMCVR